MAAVAALCVQYEAGFRPNMTIIVKALQPLYNSRPAGSESQAPFLESTSLREDKPSLIDVEYIAERLLKWVKVSDLLKKVKTSCLAICNEVEKLNVQSLIVYSYGRGALTSCPATAACSLPLPDRNGITNSLGELFHDYSGNREQRANGQSCPATAACSLPLPDRNMPKKREEK
ncbi:hypothetical protein Tco_0357122 [Tanacetum coccineum]